MGSRWDVFSDGTFSPMGRFLLWGWLLRWDGFAGEDGFAGREAFARGSAQVLRAKGSPEGRSQSRREPSSGVSARAAPGRPAFPLAGFAGKSRAQAIGSRGFARGTEQKKRSSGFSFFYEKIKMCAHTLGFFENNCIVLQCAFGDRRPGFGKGRPAAGARVRRGGGGPIRRIPQQAGSRAGVKTTGTRRRRTETRTYSAKPD